MGELWAYLNSAQENIGGIPADFLEKKKEEIRKRKVIEMKIIILETSVLLFEKEIIFLISSKLVTVLPLVFNTCLLTFWSHLN